MNRAAHLTPSPPSTPLEARADVVLGHSRATIFAALSEADARARWSAPADAAFRYVETEFVVGGRDVFECRGPGGMLLRGVVRYGDIVPGHRVVYDESLFDGATPVSTARVTIVLEAAQADATRVVMAAQLQGQPPPSLVAGYRSGLVTACAGLAWWLDSGPG